MGINKPVVIGAVAVVGLASWWVSGRQQPPVPTTVSASAVPASPSTLIVPPAAASPSPTAPTSNGADAAPSASQMSAREQAQVSAFATKFMKAFARPGKDVSARAWWERVAAMLTDDAVDLYSGISPSQVGFTTVTGPPHLEPVDPDSDGWWIQPVTVTTDAGRYRLLIQLPAAGIGDRLLVIEIQEP